MQYRIFQLFTRNMVEKYDTKWKSTKVKTTVIRGKALWPTKIFIYAFHNVQPKVNTHMRHITLLKAKGLSIQVVNCDRRKFIHSCPAPVLMMLLSISRRQPPTQFVVCFLSCKTSIALIVLPFIYCYRSIDIVLPPSWLSSGLRFSWLQSRALSWSYRVGGQGCLSLDWLSILLHVSASWWHICRQPSNAVPIFRTAWLP